MQSSSQSTGSAPLAVLNGVLEHITYTNEDTGYTVARVAGERGGDPVTVVGPLLGARARGSGPRPATTSTWGAAGATTRCTDASSRSAATGPCSRPPSRASAATWARASSGASAPRWPSASATSSGSTP